MFGVLLYPGNLGWLRDTEYISVTLPKDCKDRCLALPAGEGKCSPPRIAVPTVCNTQCISKQPISRPKARLMLRGRKRRPLIFHVPGASGPLPKFLCASLGLHCFLRIRAWNQKDLGARFIAAGGKRADGGRSEWDC